jgi:hypothetical protein
MWRQLRRQVHAWRIRLRRERAAVALLMLLTLGVGEPMLCIIHCEFWLPIAYHSYFAAQHPHSHAGHRIQPGDESAALATDSAAGAASIRASETPAAASCFMNGGLGTGAPVPFHVPPSPVHDMLPTLLIALLLVLLTHPRPLAPPGDPPSAPISSLFRPPIFCMV